MVSPSVAFNGVTNVDPPLKIESMPWARPRYDASFDLSVVTLMGGTNVVVNIVDPTGAIIAATEESRPKFPKGICSREFTWAELRSKASPQQLTPHVLMAVLTDLYITLAKDAGVEVARITRSLCSVAGPTEEDGRATLTNASVQMYRYPLTDSHAVSLTTGFMREVRAGNLEAPIPIRFRKAHVTNDGKSGTLGEAYHPKGLLRDGQGVYLIWGTGVGGGAIERLSKLNPEYKPASGELRRPMVKFVPDFSEFGHALIRNPDSSFRCLTVSEMEQQGYFVGKKFQPTKPGESYLETIVGGPWAAVGFVHYIRDYGRHVELLREIADKHPNEEANVKKLLQLESKDILHWPASVPESTALLLNQMIVNATMLSAGELKDAARSFNIGLARAWGGALAALGRRLDGPIVLGSSMAKVRRDDTEFLDALRGAANEFGPRIFISHIDSGTERECYAAARSVRVKS